MGPEKIKWDAPEAPWVCPIKKRDDKTGRAFWRHAEEASKKVSQWPVWKQKIRTTNVGKTK